MNIKKPKKQLKEINKDLTKIYTVGFMLICAFVGSFILFGEFYLYLFLVLAIYSIPFVLLYIYKKKNNEKLLLVITICEIIILTIAVIDFASMLWKGINKPDCSRWDIDNQECWNNKK